MKTAIINEATFSRFKTTEQIYYNRGFKQDAIRFQLISEEPVKKVNKITISKIVYRIITLTIFSLYYVSATATTVLRNVR
jgi:hypothetical protein